MKDDSYYLEQTLKLAKKGLGFTFPNPMVGCVIVKNGQIIAKGYHKRVGSPHAEAEAIRNAKVDLRGATLYVNLEPCSHHGKTPPCTDLIIKSGISRVVCSILDPNPKINGQGVQNLVNAGINVATGTLEIKSRLLNEQFFTYHEKKRPFIAIKFASSLDGKIATKTGESKWITSEKARKYGRFLRTQFQAILVGANTVIADNPYLDARIKNKKDPVRIVIDPTLKLPTSSNVLRDTNVIIITTIHADRSKLKEIKKREIKIIEFKTSNIPINKILEELAKQNIISLLIEGGGETIGRFVDQKMVDRVYAFHSPIIIGGETATSAILGLGAEKISDVLRLTKVSHKYLDGTMLTIADV